MTASAEKRRRHEAIRAEHQRRLAERRDRSPLSLEQLVSLHAFVAHHIGSQGHHHDFHYTSEWLATHGLPKDEALAFLRDEGVGDDWGLVVGSDPHLLLGETEERSRWMPLDRNALHALLEWLEEQLKETPCEHDHRLTKAWLEDQPGDSAATRIALVARGGGCDCEVVMNVEPDEIYPPE